MQRLAAAAASREYHILLCGQQAYSEQLVPAPRPRCRPAHCRDTVIVTGGSRGLGLQYARHQLERGAKTAVLVSRDAILPKEQLAGLAKGGKTVFSISCDAGNAGSIETVLSWAREWLPPVQASLLEAGQFLEYTVIMLLCHPEHFACNCSASSSRRSLFLPLACII